MDQDRTRAKANRGVKVNDDIVTGRKPGQILPVMLDKSKCLMYNCPYPPEARNYCSRHYRQLLRGGEFVKVIRKKVEGTCPNHPDKPILWRGLCRSCYYKEYAVLHREAIKEKRRRHYQANREAKISYVLQWQRENKERVNAKNKEWNRRKREGRMCE